MTSIMPFTTGFFSLLILSSMVIFSAPHWVAMWLGLELNLLAFTPLITQHNQLQETESAIKYFLIQASSSGLLLLSTFLLKNTPSTIPQYLLIISMLIKLGAAPFHQWFPNTMNGLAWPTALGLSTWQKLGPLFILVKTMPFSTTPLMLSIAVVSALVGGVGGLNQTQLRALLAYSSIGHLGWMMSSLSSLFITTFYFIIYTLISASIFLSLWIVFLNKTKMFNSIQNLPMAHKMLLFFSLLSLGGLPPTTGFAPKILVLYNLINSHSIWPMTLLISASLLNLYYYFSIVFSTTLNQAHTKPLPPSNLPAPSIFLVLSPLILLPLIL